ncbi:MAG: hypothetical protein WBC92_17440 [Terracidiphilus sp.]
MKNPLKIVAVIGIALGGILGMAGTMVAAQNVRAVCWALDGAALVVAASILALFFFRKSCDSVAAGFLVYAIGEAVMLGGTAGSLETSVPSFAAGTALWSAGLLLISVPKVFVIWTRLAGLIAALLFGIVSARIFWGEQLLPISRPLPYFAYPFLVLTFIGWIWTVLKKID